MSSRDQLIWIETAKTKATEKAKAKARAQLEEFLEAEAKALAESGEKLPPEFCHRRYGSEWGRRVHWFSNHGRTRAARKRKAVENIDRLIYNPGATSRRAPRISLSYCKIGILEKDKSVCCADVALSAYSRDVDGEFEVVEVVGSMYFPFVLLVHCNFIARPKGSTAAEDRLFFAELQGKLQPAVGGARPDTIFTCQGYYVLGPPASTIAGTGLSGCECCDRNPGYIKHPAAGGFTTHVDRPW